MTHEVDNAGRLKTVREWLAVWRGRQFLRMLPGAAGMIVAGVVASVYAGMYATERASNTVTDIILSNISPWDVDGIFVYGTFMLLLVVIAVCLRRPASIPFVLSATGLFYLIRSAFIMMTHIGPYPYTVNADLSVSLARFFFGADLFFSGHTGAPFLLALIFWRIPLLRGLFLGWSFFFATIVLLGHFHYTIDVAAAFFITHSIYHAATHLFPKSFALSQEDLHSRS